MGYRAGGAPTGWSVLNRVATLVLRASCLGKRGDRLKRLTERAPTFIYLTANPPVALHQPRLATVGTLRGGGYPHNQFLDYLLDWPLCTEKTAQESTVRLASIVGVECDVNEPAHVVTGQLR